MGKVISGLGACLTACDLDTGAPCGTETVCALLDSHRVCWVPESPCAGLTNDGKCDDPRGTRLCAMGTDSDDCN